MHQIGEIDHRIPRKSAGCITVLKRRATHHDPAPRLTTTRSAGIVLANPSRPRRLDRYK
jgi:hypothetical protein